MFVFQSVVNFRLVAKGLWVGSVLITVYWDSGGRVAPGLREMEGCQLGLRDGRPWITEVGRSEDVLGLEEQRAGAWGGPCAGNQDGTQKAHCVGNQGYTRTHKGWHSPALLGTTC